MTALSIDRARNAALSAFLLPTGAIAQNFDRYRGAATTAILASGTVRGCALPVPAGKPISSVTFVSGTTALAGVSHLWACLMKASDLTVAAVTSDDTTAVWGANRDKTFTFGATYTPGADELLYPALMCVATTLPSLLCVTPGNISGIILPYMGGTSSTGMTTPPVVGASLAPIASGSGSHPWCCVS